MKRKENFKKYNLYNIYKISIYIYFNYERSKENRFTLKKYTLVDINF